MSSAPSLAISDVDANEFIKEVSGINASLPEKQNAFVEKLVNDLKKPSQPPKPPKETKSAAPKKTPDDPAEKAALISKITVNVNAFEPLLRDFLKPTRQAYLEALPKKSVADLDLMLKTLEHSRTVGNMANQLKHLVFIGATAVEVATKRFGMRTEGYAQALQAQEVELQMILREIAVGRAESLSKFQRPEIRLAVLLSTTLLGLDNANRLADLRQEAKATPVTPLVEETYRDL